MTESRQLRHKNRGRRRGRGPNAVIVALLGACEAHPDQRVAQVLVNALGDDPFYVENDLAIDKLNSYAGMSL